MFILKVEQHFYHRLREDKKQHNVTVLNETFLIKASSLSSEQCTRRSTKQRSLIYL